MKRKSEDDGRRAKRRAVEADVQQLEEQIAQSRRHYNNIVTLLAMLEQAGSSSRAAAVALCRVFCRLLAGGMLESPTDASEQEAVLVAWLRERYQEYQRALTRTLRDGEPAQQIASLSLAMQLVKEHTAHLAQLPVWNGFFDDVLTAVIQPGNDGLRAHFTEAYFQKYHDIAVYSILRLTTYLDSPRDAATLDNAISLLSSLGEPAELPARFETTYTDTAKISQKARSPFVAATAFKMRVQAAWLAVLQSATITRAQRKQLLRGMAHAIAPWFAKPELLMDFLTDCLDARGSVALLSLSGLFYLIQQRNLDYAHFYTRLYALLDREALHSRHRSRFLRLLDTFLGSSHLPAALVASFVKRLSRLALAAPPAAVVAIVPWVYNMLRAHPTCTFMIHRDVRRHAGEEAWGRLEAEGMDDPFDAEERDPALTGALQSSLWEIETLQGHYHPNTAALARIISEQFTKQRYNVEDFLDLSYVSLIGTELGREEKALKRAPVVEYQIPQRIFTDRGRTLDGEDKEAGSLMRQLWEFS